jgi:RNA polymerase sigma-70 factor (ECF subfamily)
MRTKANTKQQSESDERMDLLKNWITDLPERQREAFELSRFEGLDHDEIASVMNVSSNTVNNHIVAALKRLRDRYNVYLKEKKISYD